MDIRATTTFSATAKNFDDALALAKERMIVPGIEGRGIQRMTAETTITIKGRNRVASNNPNTTEEVFYVTVENTTESPARS